MAPLLKIVIHKTQKRGQAASQMLIRTKKVLRDQTLKSRRTTAHNLMKILMRKAQPRTVLNQKKVILPIPTHQATHLHIRLQAILQTQVLPPSLLLRAPHLPIPTHQATHRMILQAQL